MAMEGAVWQTLKSRVVHPGAILRPPPFLANAGAVDAPPMPRASGMGTLNWRWAFEVGEAG